MSEENNLDLDGDGKISKKEMSIHEEKLNNQEKMAWISFIVLIITGSYMIFFAPETRIAAASSGVFDMIYLTLGGIIAIYFGSNTLMSKR